MIKQHRGAGRAQAVMVVRRRGRHIAYVAIDSGGIRKYKLTNASLQRLRRLCDCHRRAGGYSHLTYSGLLIYWRLA